MAAHVNDLRLHIRQKTAYGARYHPLRVGDMGHRRRLGEAYIGRGDVSDEGLCASLSIAHRIPGVRTLPGSAP